MGSARRPMALARASAIGNCRVDGAEVANAQGTLTAGPPATRVPRARLWAPKHMASFYGQPNFQRSAVLPRRNPTDLNPYWSPGWNYDGAIGRTAGRRNAEACVQPHFRGKPIGGKAPTVRQRDKRLRQILAREWVVYWYSFSNPRITWTHPVYTLYYSPRPAAGAQHKGHGLQRWQAMAASDTGAVQEVRGD